MLKRAVLPVALLAAGVGPVGVEAEGLRNLGLHAESLVAGPAMIAFVAPEPQNGGRDLNGDGDGDDAVVHIFDQKLQAVVNLGFSTTAIQLDGDVLGFIVSELGEGVDLNGDGDLFDLVPHVYDRRNRRTTSLGRGSGIGSFVTTSRLVVFREEGFPGQLLVYDVRRNLLREVGFAGTRHFNAVNRYVVFEVDQRVHIYDVIRAR